MDRKRPREEDNAGGGDAGGEISMSIEETNRLRISLGLKPLEVGGGPNKAEQDSARRHQEEQRKKREQEERAQRFKDKIERKRQQNEDDFLAVKGLGEADEDDDMHSWVEKSRVAEVAKRAEERYAARQAEKAATQQRKAGSDDDEEEDGERAVGYTAADLAGMKVRAGADDLAEGETLVLTLADQALLDERGRTLLDNQEDELINTLKAEDRARQKARDAAAPKAKPLWEEDGKRRGLLDKYDEEEADVVLQLGEGGIVSTTEAQKEAMKRRLAEGGKMLESAAVGILAPVSTASALNSSDYQLPSEAAAPAAASFKKKKKKERKLRAKEVEPEQEEGTASLIEQLEATQQQEGGGGDLGSRVSRATAREKAEQALREEAAVKRAKFEAAVAKGNWASMALRQQPTTQVEEVVVGEDEDADRELQESLARARRLAAQKAAKEGNGTANGDAMDTDEPAGPSSTLEAIAASAAKAREEEEARLREELAAAQRLGKERVVNDTIEFVRNIQASAGPLPAGSTAPGAATVAAGVASRAPGASTAQQPEKDNYMDLDDEDAGDTSGWATVGTEGDAAGRWVSAEEGGTKQEEAGRKNTKDEDMEQASGGGSDDDNEDNVIAERNLGRGLGSVLSLLKERGSLSAENNMTWAGRTNDRSKNALQGLIGDVYAGGGHEERLARSIESALTRKDEFGRVMTPKENFRQLCYGFHGKKPSKNKEEKRVAKAKEEIARRHNSTSEVTEVNKEVQGLTKVTEKVAQPYVMLQGKGAKEVFDSIKAGGSSSMPPPPPKNKASKGPSDKPPPPGNLTPLLGHRKVEAMLGISKPPPPGGPKAGTASVSRLAPPTSGPPR